VSNIKLGVKVRDVVTGFTGTTISRTGGPQRDAPPR